MTQVAPFRITTDDLPDLKAEVRDGLAPLLDGLNITLQQLVQASQGVPTEQFVSVTLVTDATLADSFPLTFKHSLERPQGVLMANIAPKDVNHVLTVPFVMQGFQLTDGGLVSVPWITGLLPLNSYNLTFLVR